MRRIYEYPIFDENGHLKEANYNHLQSWEGINYEAFEEGDHEFCRALLEYRNQETGDNFFHMLFKRSLYNTEGILMNIPEIFTMLRIFSHYNCTHLVNELNAETADGLNNPTHKKAPLDCLVNLINFGINRAFHSYVEDASILAFFVIEMGADLESLQDHDKQFAKLLKNDSFKIHLMIFMMLSATSKEYVQKRSIEMLLHAGRTKYQNPGDIEIPTDERAREIDVAEEVGFVRQMPNKYIVLRDIFKQYNKKCTSREDREKRLRFYRAINVIRHMEISPEKPLKKLKIYGRNVKEQEQSLKALESMCFEYIASWTDSSDTGINARGNVLHVFSGKNVLNNTNILVLKHCIQLLLEKGLDPTQTALDDKTPIERSISYSQYSHDISKNRMLFDALIDSMRIKDEIDVADIYGKAMLCSVPLLHTFHYCDASLRARLEEQAMYYVEKMLKEGGNLNIQERRDGNTLLMKASLYSHFKVFKLLVQSSKDQINFDLKDHFGRTALIILFAGKYRRKIGGEIPISYDGNWSYGEFSRKHDPVRTHYRVFDRKDNSEISECAKLLCEAKSNLDVQDNEGMTALMHASIVGCTDAVRVLIESGADVTIKSKSGGTALFYAKQWGYREIISMIEEKLNEIKNSDSIAAAEERKKILNKDAIIPEHEAELKAKTEKPVSKKAENACYKAKPIAVATEEEKGKKEMGSEGIVTPEGEDIVIPEGEVGSNEIKAANNSLLNNQNLYSIGFYTLISCTTVTCGVLYIVGAPASILITATTVTMIAVAIAAIAIGCEYCGVKK